MRKMIVAATLVAGLTGGFVGVAGAQDGGCSYPDDCEKVKSETPDSVDPDVLPEESTDPAVVESAGLPGVEVKGKQQLPVTGTDAAGLAAIGAVLVGGGAVLVWRSKGAEAEA